MSDVKYALFKVYNYKGGELNSYTNLTKEKLISNLSDYFERYDEDIFTEDGKILELDQLKENLKLIVDDKYNFFSLYATGEGFTGEIYKIENNEMFKLAFEDFTNEIAEYIYKNWRNDD